MRTKWMLEDDLLAGVSDFPVKPVNAITFHSNTVPDYLTAHYWWAYIHPKAVRFFERQWLVNLILLGNYARLRDAALVEMGESLPGITLQVACVYGDLTNCLSERATRGGGSIDVVDVLPIQLRNLRNKLPVGSPARLLAMDAMDLKLPDANYDRVLVFFLLHEQPHAERSDPRRQTRREDYYCRLCATALVASAALFVSNPARETRAVCTGFVARRNREVAAWLVRYPNAQAPFLRRFISTSGSHR